MDKLSLLILLFLISCTPEKSQQTLTGNVFGTFYQIKYKMSDITKDAIPSYIFQTNVMSPASVIKSSIDDIFNRINNSMSLYKENSEINKINSIGIVKDYQLSDDLFYVLEKALKYCEWTDNAFNPTLDSIIELWGFGYKKTNQSIPDSLSIAQLLNNIGCDKIILNQKNQTLTKLSKEVTLNLNAIAKGYAVDLIHNMFKNYKINHYMINIGGEIRTKGLNFNNSAWKIDIAYPDTVNDYQKSIIRLSLSNYSIATSGDYNNYFIQDENLYSHIFDYRTGYPINNNVISATIISKNCIDADALATASMVLGRSVLDLVNYRDSIGICLIEYDVKREMPKIYSNEYFKEFVVN